MFSFLGNRAADSEAFAERRIVYGAICGSSNVKGVGSVQYQAVTDKDEREEPREEAVNSPDLESHETYGVNSTITTTTSGHHDLDEKFINGKGDAGSKEHTSVLAVPNVKMVLFLTCITQVRQNQKHYTSPIFDVRTRHPSNTQPQTAVLLIIAVLNVKMVPFLHCVRR